MSIYNTPYGLDKPQWVEELRHWSLLNRWVLRDKRRDYGSLAKFSIRERWCAYLYPGNAIHQYVGEFADLEQGKKALEILSENRHADIKEYR